MRPLLALLLLVLSLGAAPAAAQPQRPERPVAVEVVRDGTTWTATYRFPRSSPVWVFPRSAVTEHAPRHPWRPTSWEVTTPGVRLERIGNYDALVGADGVVPLTVTIRFTPSSDVLVADYTPALVFSDGTVALYDQHFRIVPVVSTDAVRELPVDLAERRENAVETIATFRDEGGPVFHAGRRQAEVTAGQRDTYILFGATQPLVTAAMAALIDPGLPEWLRVMLSQTTPAILARYADLLGPAPGGKPTLFVTWMGPTAGVSSMNGGVVPGTVIMRFEGEGIVAENRQLADSVRWFIAHEGAHFWLGQAVMYEFSRDAWIMEGGADLLAVRTVQALDPDYDWRAMLNTSIADCIRLTRGRALATAENRGEHRAYYACGAIFSLVAEAKSGRPFYAFVRRLVDANRSDGVVTRGEWLAELDRVSGDPSLSRDIVQLLDVGVADPSIAIESLLLRAGIPHRRTPEGAVVLT